MNIPFIIRKRIFLEEIQGQTQKRRLRSNLLDRIVIDSRESIQVLAKIEPCLCVKFLCTVMA